MGASGAEAAEGEGRRHTVSSSQRQAAPQAPSAMRDFRTRVGVSLCRLAPVGRGMEIGDWRLGHGWLTDGCLTT
jgi:hypothetical protein